MYAVIRYEAGAAFPNGRFETKEEANRHKKHVESCHKDADVRIEDDGQPKKKAAS